jgi:hypothetical protein
MATTTGGFAGRIPARLSPPVLPPVPTKLSVAKPAIGLTVQRRVEGKLKLRAQMGQFRASTFFSVLADLSGLLSRSFGS